MSFIVKYWPLYSVYVYFWEHGPVGVSSSFESHVLTNFRSKLLSLVSLLLLLWFSNPVWAYRPRISFQHWFPDVEAELSHIVANNCSTEFQEYLDERIVNYGVHCVKTFNCIVNCCTEYTKANMASAAVLLGLTPAILAALGSSTSELSRLAARRPVLALLMVLGSPAANPIRTFDYHSPIKDLEIEDDELEIRGLPEAQDRLLAIIQLLFGLGCVINLGVLCATINLYSVSVMSCDYSDIAVEMWIVAALFTHIFGVVTFYTRARNNLFRCRTKTSLVEALAPERIPYMYKAHMTTNWNGNPRTQRSSLCLGLHRYSPSSTCRMEPCNSRLCTLLVYQTQI